MLSACATTPVELADPERQKDFQERLARQPFRGTWWNLYERAFIYQDYELWDHAEADIRSALALRNVDQRWARTYGLHFTPEYFPNRELGIVLYRKGQLPEAKDYLEISLDQHFTARAAYYLDRARRESLSSDIQDTEGPEIEVVSLPVGAVTSVTEFDLEIIVRDDSFVSAVEIAGDSIHLPMSEAKVSIAHKVALEAGMNIISVSAIDLLGNRSERAIRLRADVDGPTVSFSTPIILPGKISGVALDTSGVRSLYIGDLQATLTPMDAGEMAFEIAVEDLSGTFIPQFRCIDTLGNTTEGLLPIDAVVSKEARSGGIRFAAPPSVVPLNGEIAAVYSGGKILAVFRASQSQDVEIGPRIEFTNLFDGQRYLNDEIVVTLKVQSRDPIQGIELNGEPIDSIIAGRRTQRISRRVRIEKPGIHQVSATAYDTAGRSNRITATIERRLPQVEEVSARLSVALLGEVSQTQDVTLLEHAEFLGAALPNILDDRGRFHVLDRNNIDTIIEEQFLIAALSSVKESERLGQLRLTDYSLIADLRRYDANNIEILLHAIDSLTARTTVVDVYGPAETREQLRELTYDLALRLEQKFPRVQGNLLHINRNNNRLRSNLAEKDRVWKSMYCVVYRPVEVIDPVTLASLGTDLIPIAQGTLRDIRRKGSTVRLLIENANAASGGPKLTDLIITK